MTFYHACAENYHLRIVGFAKRKHLVEKIGTFLIFDRARNVQHNQTSNNEEYSTHCRRTIVMSAITPIRHITNRPYCLRNNDNS